MASQCAFGFAAAAALVALRARAALRRLAPPGGVDDDAGSFAVIPGAPKQLSTRSSLFTKKKKYPRHINLEAAIDPKELEGLFPAIKANWKGAVLDYTETIGYSRYKNWSISCYLRVWDGWTPRTGSHAPLVAVMDPILDEAQRLFTEWYKEYHGLAAVEVLLMNSFVTRYRPVNDEDQLKKHVDGRKVDGSLILDLPTDMPYEGGKLSVWDGPDRTETLYQMKPGDLMMLDNMVWHQAHPITSGERWALVIFFKCKWKAAPGGKAGKTGKTEKTVKTVKTVKTGKMGTAGVAALDGPEGKAVAGGTDAEEARGKA